MVRGRRAGVTRARLWAIALVSLTITATVLGVSLPSDRSPAGNPPASPSPLGTSSPGTTHAAFPSPDAGSGAGLVLSTIDLVDNRTLPGSTQPASQNVPEFVVYDPVNGDLYVRGGETGDSLTVLNGSTDRAVAEVAVPDAQNTYLLTPTMAVDTATGAVYVTNAQESSVSVVNGTTNLVTASITVGGSPNGIVFDPSNGDFYIANYGGDSVNIVNAATNTVGTPIPVGTHPSAILFDSSSDQLFVANWGSGNVSVIDAATNTLVTNIKTGNYPVALALDTDDDRVDVANDNNGGQGNVTVIQAPATASTHGTNIGAGLDPNALAYAPTRDQLFVTNGGSKNVSVIDQTTGVVVKNPYLNLDPGAAVYDPTSRDVYVLNELTLVLPTNVTILNPATDTSPGNVTIDNWDAYGLAVDTANGNVFAISEGSYQQSGAPTQAQANATVISGTTGRSIASIPLDVYPTGITYDPLDGQLIVADPAGNDTYLVDPITGAINGTVPVDLLPEQSAVDTANGEVYVLDDTPRIPSTGAVTVLSSSLQPITTIPISSDPSAIAYDAADGDFYVTDEYWGNITVINGTHNSIVGTISVKEYNELYAILYDPHNHDLYVSNGDTNDNITVLNGSASPSPLFLGNVTAGSFPISFTFDPENDTVFVANSVSDNLSVIRDATNRVVATVRSLAVGPGAITYDDANNLVYASAQYAGDVVAVNASSYLPVGSLLSLGTVEYPHSIAYDPASDRVYVTTEYQGSVSVIGPPGYPVSFVESGLPVDTSWSVTLAGLLNSSTSTEVGFSEPNGTFAFTVGTVSGYTANITSGSVTVNGTARTVDITFTAISGAKRYAVTFSETGLPIGTSWSVTLAGSLNSSTGLEIGFSELNGTYSFTVGTVSGYTANITSGSVTVKGAARTIDIGFTAVPRTTSYPVTFTESGLPVGTSWSVTFAGHLNTSTSTEVGFSETNGTYAYTVGAVTDYTARPSAGSVTVNGGPAAQPIAFTVGIAALSVTLVASPSSIVTGNETNFTATVSGGVAPYTLSYSGLPGGCTSGNTTALACRPTATGTFLVTVTVTDARSSTANANASLTVKAAGGPGTSSSPTSNGWEWWILIVVIAAVALIVVLAYRRRRKPAPTAEATAAPADASSGSPRT